MAEAAPWAVYDSNAKPGEIRSHTIIIRLIEGREPETKTYKIGSDDPTMMPPDHARKYMHDTAFIVLNQEGVRQEVQVKQPGAEGIRHLEENQIVATYDELNKKALYDRLKLLPNTDAIKFGQINQPEMIAFLKNARRAKEAAERAAGSDGMLVDQAGNPVEAADDGSIAALFDGAESALDDITV